MTLRHFVSFCFRTEWLKLRAEYLDLQKQSMKHLKENLSAMKTAASQCLIQYNVTSLSVLSKTPSCM